MSQREECEWNPAAQRPAWDTDAPHGEAKVSVGSANRTNWHLCEACAALPKFQRMKKRSLGTRRVSP